jgi:hypothetical protein
MELKNLVPPLELCKLIPQGEFEDSAFIWGYSCDKRITEPFVDFREDVEFCRRNMVNAPPSYPAPTLQEIMEVLPHDDAYNDLLIGYSAKVDKITGWHIYYNGDRNRHCYDQIAVIAALKLWLNLKGIEA